MPLNNMPSDMISDLQGMQRYFHDHIIAAMQIIHDGNDNNAIITLSIIGFLYGIIHAVGPGHGKFVISSYIMASRSSLQRGIFLTFVSSMMQAVTAVVLVMGLAQLIHLSHHNAEETARWLELISAAGVAVLGILLFYRGWRELQRHQHSEHCGCSHTHTPEPEKFISQSSWHDMAVIIFSIGVRPCSGALLLLLFANLLHVMWAGIIATFAMAAGTAIATGALASLAVYSKNLALKYARVTDDKNNRIHAWLSIIFGLCILLGIVILIYANLQTPAAASAHPLFISKPK
jgi:nickel/cobalt exporter